MVGAVVLGAGYGYWSRSEGPVGLALGLLIATLIGAVVVGALWALTALLTWSPRGSSADGAALG